MSLAFNQLKRHQHQATAIMAGAAPFFVTPATLSAAAAPFFATPATLSAAASDATSSDKRASKKRKATSAPFSAATSDDNTSIDTSSSKKQKASTVDSGTSLRSSIETLVAKALVGTVLLSDVRDALLGHMIASPATELKHTVLLVCEDVPDLQSVAAAAADGTSDQTATATPLPLAFLDCTDSDDRWLRFRAQLSDGDSIPRCDATLLRVPVSKRDLEKAKHAAKKALKMKIKHFKKQTGANGKPTAEFYVLTPDELALHVSSVPFDDATRAIDFVTTQPRDASAVSSESPLVFAVDCEMCRTTKGVELARVTLIDGATKAVALDAFVRPENPIIDYCTQYSGITAAIMEQTTLRLSDVQQQILKLVPADAILVGHSIENDLLALKLLHHRLIDTTALYPHPRGLPSRSALRFLASTYLQRTIQASANGHCSIEDATATLDLLFLKLKRGATFPTITDAATTSSYKQKHVVNELGRRHKSVLLVDTQRACRALSAGASTAAAIVSDDNDAVAYNVVHQLTTGFPPALTWARVRNATRAEVAAIVTTIQTHLPAHACLVVVLASDASALRALHKLRTTRADPRASLQWDTSMQAQLDAAATHAQQGLVHVFLS